MNLKEELLAPVEPETIRVTFRGKSLRVVQMSSGERDLYETAQHEANVRRSEGKSAAVNFRARLVAHTLIDDTGNRVFDESDVEAISRLPSGVIRESFNAAMKLNPVSDTDTKEATKNS